MGLAVAVTVVCRRSNDASVRDTAVVLDGRRGVSGDGERGTRLWSDGISERSSRGCRSSDIGAEDDGWRGGIIPQRVNSRARAANCKFLLRRRRLMGAVAG